MLLNCLVGKETKRNQLKPVPLSGGLRHLDSQDAFVSWLLCVPELLHCKLHPCWPSDKASGTRRAADLGSIFAFDVDFFSRSGHTYLLTYAHRSQWSVGHQRPPAMALCSGLLLSFRISWSPAVSALLQCLASNCCEAGLSSSSRSGLGVWCWMLAS